MGRYVVEVAIIAIVAILILGNVGRYDFLDQQKIQAEYCENVASGNWPDYNQNFNELCGGNNDAI